MSYKISVIIVNWNVRDCLRRCLASIYAKTRQIEFEVYVVDNNSSDASPEMVRSEFPQVRLIANSENSGFGRANNMALEKCGAEYVLFLNPDTELVDNSLKAMVEFMDAHPEAAGMGCKLEYSDGTLQHSCRGFPSLFTDFMENMYLDALFPHSRFFNRYRMGSWAHDSLREADVPAGACLLVKRDFLNKIGFFDTRFFMYYDEIDLCYRIKKNGGKLFFVPNIKVIHHTNQSSKQIPLETMHWKYGSKIRFFDKHYGRLSVAGLFLILTMCSFVAWTIFPLAHFLSGRPRDVGYAQSFFRVMWDEYIKFIRSPKRTGDV